MEALFRRDWTVVVESKENLGWRRREKTDLPFVEGVSSAFFQTSTCNCPICLVRSPSLLIATFLPSCCHALRLHQILVREYYSSAPGGCRWESWAVQWNQEVARETSFECFWSLEVAGDHICDQLLSSWLHKSSHFYPSLECCSVWLEQAKHHVLRLCRG